MSEARTRAIVVSEDPQVHAMLAASCDWDLQHPVVGVPQMWDDLVAGRLTNEGVDLVVLATAILDDDLVAAAASMAPWAVTVVTCFADPTAVLPIRSTVESSIRASHDENPAIPVDNVRLIVTAVRDAPEAVRSVQAAAGALLPSVAASVGISTVPPLGRQPDHPGPVDPQLSDHLAGRDPLTSVVESDTPGRPPAIVLAVTSGSGGVGTTAVACLLASVIARGSSAAGRPHRVVLLDIDDRPQCGAPTLVGLAESDAGPDALRRKDAEDSWRQSPVARSWVSIELGIDVVTVPARQSADRAWLANVLRNLVDEFVADIVVVDVPAHIPAEVLEATDRVLVVSTMTRAALAAAAMRASSCSVDCDSLLNRVIPGTGIDVDAAGVMLGGVSPIGVLPAAVRDFDLMVNHRALHRIHEHDVLAPLLYAAASALVPDVELLRDVAVPSASDDLTALTATGLSSTSAAANVLTRNPSPHGRPPAAAWT